MKEVSDIIGEMSDKYIEYLIEDSPVAMIDSGHIVVNTLPTSALPIKVADGWTIQSEELGKEKDVFMCYAEQGWTLPEHTHLQNEHIEVLQGSLTVWVKGKRYDLEEGEELHIDSYVPHVCCAEESDAKLRVTFIPPITRKINTYATY